MSLQKKPLKTRPISKVTFRLPKDAARNAKKVALVGDFNDWNPTATPMQRLSNGEFKATVDLEQGHRYQFRYLIEGRTWENDGDADSYTYSGIGDSENSVVEV